MYGGRVRQLLGKLTLLWQAGRAAWDLFQQVAKIAQTNKKLAHITHA